jgi:hypothetical protein
MNATLQARQIQNAALNGVIQGEVIQSASLNAYTALFTQYTVGASLNANLIATTLLNGLQRYYKLDGDGVDAVGGQNAVVSNPTYVTGKLGQGARIAGNTSKSIVAPGLNLMTAISISMWVYWTGSNTYAMVVGNMDGGGGTDLNYAILTGGTSMTFYGTGNSPSSSSPSMSQNTWHHVVATRTLAGVTQFWTNGVAGSAVAGAAPYSVPAADFRIGHREDNYASFPGDIDDVAVWNRVLTSGEIAELYNAGAGFQLPI